MNKFFIQFYFFYSQIIFDITDFREPSKLIFFLHFFFFIKTLKTVSQKGFNAKININGQEINHSKK